MEPEPLGVVIFWAAPEPVPVPISRSVGAACRLLLSGKQKIKVFFLYPVLRMNAVQ